jgi:hypothetical protein
MTGPKKPPTEFEAFTAVVDKVLSVPKYEILRREAEYRKRSSSNGT